MVAGNTFGAQNAHPGVQVQRSGGVFRGNGSPSPLFGKPGTPYINMLTNTLHLKTEGVGRTTTRTPWIAIATLNEPSYVSLIRWYGDAEPSPSIGQDGDYYIKLGCDNPQMLPEVYGPKSGTTWPHIDNPDIEPA